VSKVSPIYKDVKREPKIKARSKDNGKYVCSLVPANMVTTLGSQVEAKLGPVIARSRGRWDMNYLIKSLVTGEQQLWIAMTNDDDAFIDGVAVTELITYPTGLKMLAIRYIGGENMNDWVWPGLDIMDRFARDAECQGIEASARFGFWKWLEGDGFARGFTMYEKML
jgi:hypothetical protein